MIHIDSGELNELRHCVGALELVLAKLDRIGAGIAAIHVDAAIDQLRNNIDVVIPCDAEGREQALICLHEFCGPPGFTFAKDA